MEVVGPEAVTSDGSGVDHEPGVVGRAETIQSAFDATRKGGAIVIVGRCGLEPHWPISLLAMVTQEKTVRGTTYSAVNVR